MRETDMLASAARKKRLPGVTRRVLVLTLSGLLFAAGPSTAQGAAVFKVVVQASNSVSSLPEKEVSRLFLKKTIKWAGGIKVLPVDQLEKSTVREAFSREVHGKDVRAIKSYWQTMLFAGRATPPPELASDAEILSYVRSNSGAIGYVSKGTGVGDGVKVVTISD